MTTEDLMAKAMAELDAAYAELRKWHSDALALNKHAREYETASCRFFSAQEAIHALKDAIASIIRK